MIRAVILSWMKFNAVGLMGVVVQLSTLALGTRLGMNYLLVTALAVELAVLHNYIWHKQWTWRGRPGSLWRFQLSNGLLSLISNLFLMRLLTGGAGLPPVPANLLAITCTSLLNFWISERWVFLAYR